MREALSRSLRLQQGDRRISTGLLVTGVAEKPNVVQRTKVEEEKLLGNVITLSDKQVNNYQTHGFCSVHLEILFATSTLIIDTYPLQEKTPPRYAWFKRFAPTSVEVIISSGCKQQVSHKSEKLDSNQTLEGLKVTFYNFYASPSKQIPYEAKLKPLYGTA